MPRSHHQNAARIRTSFSQHPSELPPVSVTDTRLACDQTQSTIAPLENSHPHELSTTRTTHQNTARIRTTFGHHPSELPHVSGTLSVTHLDGNALRRTPPVSWLSITDLEMDSVELLLRLLHWTGPRHELSTTAKTVFQDHRLNFTIEDAQQWGVEV